MSKPNWIEMALAAVAAAGGDVVRRSGDRSKGFTQTNQIPDLSFASCKKILHEKAFHMSAKKRAPGLCRPGAPGFMSGFFLAKIKRAFRLRKSGRPRAL
ncbi:MAG: hypothetical protein H6628_14580 [Calditrichae bacterium]|nr:hypothetical protein [Calditrichia bacterium]